MPRQLIGSGLAFVCLFASIVCLDTNGTKRSSVIHLLHEGVQVTTSGSNFKDRLVLNKEQHKQINREGDNVQAKEMSRENFMREIQKIVSDAIVFPKEDDQNPQFHFPLKSWVESISTVQIPKRNAPLDYAEKDIIHSSSNENKCEQNNENNVKILQENMKMLKNLLTEIKNERLLLENLKANQYKELNATNNVKNNVDYNQVTEIPQKLILTNNSTTIAPDPLKENSVLKPKPTAEENLKLPINNTRIEAPKPKPQANKHNLFLGLPF